MLLRISRLATVEKTQQLLHGLWFRMSDAYDTQLEEPEGVPWERRGRYAMGKRASEIRRA